MPSKKQQRAMIRGQQQLAKTQMHALTEQDKKALLERFKNLKSPVRHLSLRSLTKPKKPVVNWMMTSMGSYMRHLRPSRTQVAHPHHWSLVSAITKQAKLSKCVLFPKASHSSHLTENSSPITRH